jgi:outer membrane immunogenic protein
MKKTLLAGVATGALAIVAPANAADLRMPVKAAPAVAPAPYFSWTGCYIGTHVGWGWGRKDFNGVLNSSSHIPVRSSVDTSGALFGGQLGCNYQLQNNFVIGLEGSVSGADINGFNIGTGCSSQLLRAKTDFLGSITGRIGWTGWNPAVLFYFKGGVAFAHDRYEHTTTFAVGDQSRTGWTIGLGAEWAFAPSWTAFVEWDHYDFGTKSVTLTPFDDPGEINFLDVKQTVETVRIGVNYRFNVGFLGVGKAPIAARY